jgi:hypothetical protein
MRQVELRTSSRWSAATAVSLSCTCLLASCQCYCWSLESITATSHGRKEESRLWQLEGLVAVYSARATVLGAPLPLVEQLISIIGSKKHVGWYTSGAAIGAYCRSVVRMRFHYVYGAMAGESLFSEWYSGFCRKVRVYLTNTLY